MGVLQDEHLVKGRIAQGLHRDRQEKLEIAAEEARALLSERRAVLDNVDTIAAFAEDMSDFLMTSEITESRAFIKSFVKEIKVKPGKATVFYTLPTPPDSPIGGGDAAEVALHGPVVRSSVHVGGCTRTRPTTRGWTPSIRIGQHRQTFATVVGVSRFWRPIKNNGTPCSTCFAGTSRSASVG